MLQSISTVAGAPGAAIAPAHAVGRIGSRIDVRGVACRYGRVTILDELDLSIEPGEFITLLGPSGSGKSTLLGLLAGFVQLAAGEILVDGNAVQGVPAHERGFGMVFQNYALFPHMTVAQNVGFPLRMAGIGRADADARVAEVLDVVRLAEHAAKLPSQLSGGQQQRVAIARAIVRRPRVVLMDEPLSALDRRLRESTLMEIRNLHRQLGMTVVFVTHDQGEALALSDRIAVLEAGRIVQLGSPSDLYRRPANKFVAGFVGESNLIEVDVIDCRGGVATVKDHAGHRFDADAGDRHLPNGPAVVLVRPERVRLVPAGTPGALRGTVTEVVFLGEILRVDVRLASGATLQVRGLDRSSGSLPVIGDDVHVAWSADDCWVLA